jgi:hypothetical protein
VRKKGKGKGGELGRRTGKLGCMGRWRAGGRRRLAAYFARRLRKRKGKKRNRPWGRERPTGLKERKGEGRRVLGFSF